MPASWLAPGIDHRRPGVPATGGSAGRSPANPGIEQLASTPAPAEICHPGVHLAGISAGQVVLQLEDENGATCRSRHQTIGRCQDVHLVLIEAGHAGAAAGGDARRPPTEPGIEHLASTPARAASWRQSRDLMSIGAYEVGAAAGVYLEVDKTKMRQAFADVLEWCNIPTRDMK